jgi:hypothetical protein
MGLRDLFRKYRKKHDASPCSSDASSTKIQPTIPPPSQQQQQQEKQDKSNLLNCIDLNTTA